MKFIIIGLLSLFYLGCTDTTPEVRYLVDPSLLRVSDKTFAEGNMAAATTITASGYQGKVMVHEGTKLNQSVTTDNTYVMTIRKISY